MNSNHIVILIEIFCKVTTRQKVTFIHVLQENVMSVLMD